MYIDMPHQYIYITGVKMTNGLVRLSAALAILLASAGSQGQTFSYLPESDPNAVGAVITAGSANFSFSIAPFLKVEGFGGLSVSDTGVRSAANASALVFDTIGDGDGGQISYHASEYRVAGAIESLWVSTFGKSATDFQLTPATVHVAGGLRIELPSGDMSYQPLKGRPGPGGIANVLGGFVEITNIVMSGGIVVGTVSGGNGLVARDHVLLWSAADCEGYSCLASREVSEADGLDLMSWTEKAVSPNQKLNATANEMFRQGLGVTGFADIDYAHPYQMIMVDVMTLTGAETSAQFQSPIGYLHGPLPTPVPEPGSILLMCLGLAGVAAGVRRQASVA